MPTGPSQIQIPDAIEFRADELAARVGITVELLRSYQSKGLLAPPRRVGRIVWYGPSHERRLHRIRELKERGYSLKMIVETVQADQLGSAEGELSPEWLDLPDVVEATGVPVELIRSLEASHVVRPELNGKEVHYTEQDVDAVRKVLEVLGVGLPLDEFMAVSATQLAIIDKLAADVVSTWDERVCEPIRAEGLDFDELMVRIESSMRTMVASVSGLVAYNIERAVLNAAQAHVSRFYGVQDGNL